MLSNSPYIAGSNGFFVAMILLKWWRMAFDKRENGDVDNEMSDAAWKEERNIWHEHVDNARELFASTLGRRYDRITTILHVPVSRAVRNHKRRRSVIESDDEMADTRGMY